MQALAVISLLKPLMSMRCLALCVQVRSSKWRRARELSDELLQFITNSSGSATLEDIRRQGRGSMSMSLTSSDVDMHER